MAGSGPHERNVRAFSRALHISDRVHFLGEVPFEWLPDLYATCDIKVIASDFESFSFAALEAMASGLPLVTTDNGWVPILLDGDEGGIVTPVGDDRALSEAMSALARNPALRKRMGRRNRDLAVARYGWGPSAKKLFECYKNLLS